MRVLLVAQGYPPVDAGGVELTTAFLARGLAARGHRVAVFCREADPDRPDGAHRCEHDEGVPVHRVVNNFRRHAGIRDYYENGFFDDRFAEVLGDERPDVVHFQHLIGLSTSLLPAAATSGARVVLTLHDYFFLCHRVQLLTGTMELCDGPEGGWKCGACVGPVGAALAARPRLRSVARRLRRALPARVGGWLARGFLTRRVEADEPFVARFRHMEALLRVPDLVCFPSEFVRATFVRHYPFLRVGVVEPLGIAGASVAGAAPPPPPLRVLYLGSLLPFKGVHVLLDALRRLQGAPITLAIHGFAGFGADAYVADLRRRAQGLAVAFGGAYRQEDLPRLLAGAHVLVLPSVCFETFSLVIREARAARLAVVASDLGALPEAVRDGVDGWLVPAGDADALAAALRRFVDDSGLAPRMGAAGPAPTSGDEYAAAMLARYERLGSAAA